MTTPLTTLARPEAFAVISRNTTLERFDRNDLNITNGARAERLLIERLASRISASCDEIAAFTDVDSALTAIVAQFVVGRRVVLAQPARDTLASKVGVAARRVDVTTWPIDGDPQVASPESRRTMLDSIALAAKDADVVVVSTPVLRNGLARTALGPRELLRLRSRAPRPLLILDLLDEDLVPEPLTQTAMLLPGTLILRGFGDAWREFGAATVARSAFVAGSRELLASLAALANTQRVPEVLAQLVAELDIPEIDRLTQIAARRARAEAAARRDFRGD